VRGERGCLFRCSPGHTPKVRHALVFTVPTVGDTTSSMGVTLGQKLLCAPPAVGDLSSGVGLDTLTHRQVKPVNERIGSPKPEWLMQDISQVHEFILDSPEG